MEIIKETASEIVIASHGYQITKFNNGYAPVYYATKIDRNNRYLPEILLFVKEGKLESALRPWNYIPCEEVQKYIDGIQQAVSCLKEAGDFFATR